MTKIAFIKQFIRFCAVTPPMIAIFGGGLMGIIGNFTDDDALRTFGLFLIVIGMLLMVLWVAAKEKYDKEKFLKEIENLKLKR